MIPNERQDILEVNIHAVVGSLRSDFLAHGSVVPISEEVASL